MSEKKKQQTNKQKSADKNGQKATLSLSFLCCLVAKPGISKSNQ